MTFDLVDPMVTLPYECCVGETDVEMRRLIEPSLYWKSWNLYPRS
jgi:hypothetical protein